MIKLDHTKQIEHKEYIVVAKIIVDRLYKLFFDNAYNEIRNDFYHSDFAAVKACFAEDVGVNIEIPSEVMTIHGMRNADKEDFYVFGAPYPKKYLQEIYEKICIDDDYLRAKETIYISRQLSNVIREIKLDHTKEIDHKEFIVADAIIVNRLYKLFFSEGYNEEPNDYHHSDFFAVKACLAENVGIDIEIPSEVETIDSMMRTDKEYLYVFGAPYPKEYLQEIYKKLCFGQYDLIIPDHEHDGLPMEVDIKLDHTKQIDHKEYIAVDNVTSIRLCKLFKDGGCKDLFLWPVDWFDEDDDIEIPSEVKTIDGMMRTGEYHFDIFGAPYPKEYIQKIYEKLCSDDYCLKGERDLYKW